MKRNYLGQCHCGKLRFEVEGADLEDERNAICNCTMCTMNGFLHHHVPKSALKVRDGKKKLTLYQFGTKKAEHLFCKHCGIEAYYQSRSDPDMWDVNIRCLVDAASGERVNIYGLKYELSDGEHWEETQEARKARADARVRPTLWRLVGPVETDVATEFRKTWDKS